MTEILTYWLPTSGLVLLSFGLAIVTAKQGERIRLLKIENSKLRVKQVELENTYMKLQEKAKQLHAAEIEKLEKKLTDAQWEIAQLGGKNFFSALLEAEFEKPK